MSETHDELIASLFRAVRVAIGEDDIEAARRAVNKAHDALDATNPPEASEPQVTYPTLPPSAVMTPRPQP